eukprot:COSAG05_NODE_9519_length_618_cov_1.813102_1_plen_189_part_10
MWQTCHSCILSHFARSLVMSTSQPVRPVPPPRRATDSARMEVILLLAMPCLACGQAACTTLPPLLHPGGSWEPVEQQQSKVDTVEECCHLAHGKAYTYYLSKFCYVDTGNGAREFHVGAPASYMFPPPPPEPEPEPPLEPEPEPEWQFAIALTRDHLLGGAAALVAVLIMALFYSLCRTCPRPTCHCHR